MLSTHEYTQKNIVGLNNLYTKIESMDELVHAF